MNDNGYIKPPLKYNKSPIWKRQQIGKHLGWYLNKNNVKCIVGTQIQASDTYCPNYQVWNECVLKNLSKCDKSHACSICGVQFHGALRCPNNPLKLQE